MSKCKNIGWQFYSAKTGEKICGGSFGGSLDADTANRLVRAYGCKVTVTASGSPVFVDRDGREVYLHLIVHPLMTEIGSEAYSLWLAEERYRREQEDEIHRKRLQEIDVLMNSMSCEEIIRRLTAKVE